MLTCYYYPVNFSLHQNPIKLYPHSGVAQAMVQAPAREPKPTASIYWPGPRVTPLTTISNFLTYPVDY